MLVPWIDDYVNYKIIGNVDASTVLSIVEDSLKKDKNPADLMYIKNEDLLWWPGIVSLYKGRRVSHDKVFDRVMYLIQFKFNPNTTKSGRDMMKEFEELYTNTYGYLDNDLESRVRSYHLDNIVSEIETRANEKLSYKLTTSGESVILDSQVVEFNRRMIEYKLLPRGYYEQNPKMYTVSSYESVKERLTKFIEYWDRINNCSKYFMFFVLDRMTNLYDYVVREYVETREIVFNDSEIERLCKVYMFLRTI